MNTISYQPSLETIDNMAKLRREHSRLACKAKTYRRRALILVGRLAEEREYRRCAEHLAETMRQHATVVEQEYAELHKLLSEMRIECQKAYRILDRYYDDIWPRALGAHTALESVLFELERHFPEAPKAGPCSETRTDRSQSRG